MKIEILKKATKQTEFHKFLLKENACPAGYRMARKFEDPQEFWEKIPHVGWLVWLSDNVRYEETARDLLSFWGNPGHRKS